MLPNWARYDAVAIDIETNDPQLKELGIGSRRDGYIIGVSFAMWKGNKPEAYYLPFAHGVDKMIEGNMDPVRVIGYLQDQARNFKGDIIGANLPYDLDYLDKVGVKFNEEHVKFRDVQIAEPLINELRMSYSLQNIAQLYGLGGKSEDLMNQACDAMGIYVNNRKKEMWTLPPKYVAVYAQDDTVLPLLIYREQKKQLKQKGLWDIFELETKVLPCLLRMRDRGVRVDPDRLRPIAIAVETEEHRCYQEIKRITGSQLSEDVIWNTRALEPVLEARGYEFGVTPTGKRSIRQGDLMMSDDAVVRLIVEARKKNKLRNTFIMGMDKHMINNRVHCQFVQIAQETEQGGTAGVRYGRLSSRHPNLQQQPTRDPMAADWRNIFLPEKGQLWASCDYSQQEPRWTTHMAARAGLTGASEAEQAYIDDPNLDNYDFMAELTGQSRKHAKAISLGLCYGEGGAKLCSELDLPTGFSFYYDNEQCGPWEVKEEMFAAAEGLGIDLVKLDMDVEVPKDKYGWWVSAGKEGQKIINTFNERAPYIKELAKSSSHTAKRRKMVETVGGRQLHFPNVRNKTTGKWETGFTHKGLNRRIQGSAADQAKAAMVELDRQGFHMMLQIHDEFALSVGSREEGEAAAEIMRNAHKDLKHADDVRIPFKVDVEVGPSWGEAE